MSKKKLTAGSRITGATIEKQEVKINYKPSSEVHPVFANQMIVQTDESSTYLSFFCLQPPMILGSQNEILRQVEGMTSIDANLTAQVIIPRDCLQKFVEVLKSNLGRQQVAISAEPDSSARIPDSSARITS